MKRTLAIAAATVALTLSGASAASAACPRTPAPGTVSIKWTDPILRYELKQPYDPSTESQLDGGTMKVTYRCTPNDTTRGIFMNVVVRTPSLIVAQMYNSDPLPCDGAKHTETFTLNRGIDYPFTPPARFERGTVDVVFGVKDDDEATPDQEEVTRPLLVRYVGW